MLRDLTTGRTTALTQDWDRSVTSIDWAHDSRSLYAIALDTQETPLWRIDARSGKVTRLTDNGTVSSLAVTARGALVTMTSLTAPDDPNRTGDERSLHRLTRVNGARLAGIDMPSVSQFSFAGATGDPVLGSSASA